MLGKCLRVRTSECSSEGLSGRLLFKISDCARYERQQYLSRFFSREAAVGHHLDRCIKERDEVTACRHGRRMIQSFELCLYAERLATEVPCDLTSNLNSFRITFDTHKRAREPLRSQLCTAY